MYITELSIKRPVVALVFSMRNWTALVAVPFASDQPEKANIKLVNST